MHDKLRFSASVLCLLATAILLTIYLAWLFYPLEISYFNLTDKVYLKAETIQYNFNILMNYLTNPFSQKLAMPDFRSSAAGLYHFQAVKYLFHLAQVVFVLTLPAFIFFLQKVIKKGFLALYQKSSQKGIFGSLQTGFSGDWSFATCLCWTGLSDWL